MNDEQLFLANAYLDGELTADERRIAETDPDIMAEVEQLRGIQAQLRAVDPPSSSARESAITAAMAEFERTSAVTTTTTTTTTTNRTTSVPARTPARAPIPFRPRPFSARFLAVAAAIVAVGALGIIITQAGGGGDDDFAGEPTAQDVGDAALVESRRPSEDSADAADDADGGGAADGALAEPAAESTMEMADAGAAEMSEEMADEAAELAAADEATTFATAPADFDPDEPITDEFQLGAYGRYLLDEQTTNRLGPTPNTACPAEFNILGETIYVQDQDPTDVYVAVQEAERRVIALDQSTCEPIGEGPLTEPTGG